MVRVLVLTQTNGGRCTYDTVERRRDIETFSRSLSPSSRGRSQSFVVSTTFRTSSLTEKANVYVEEGEKEDATAINPTSLYSIMSSPGSVINIRKFAATVALELSEVRDKHTALSASGGYVLVLDNDLIDHHHSMIAHQPHSVGMSHFHASNNASVS